MKTTAILDMLLEKVYDIFWFLFKHDMRAANVMGGGGGGGSAHSNRIARVFVARIHRLRKWMTDQTESQTFGPTRYSHGI